MPFLQKEKTSTFLDSVSRVGDHTLKDRNSLYCPLYFYYGVLLQMWDHKLKTYLKNTCR